LLSHPQESVRFEKGTVKLNATKTDQDNSKQVPQHGKFHGRDLAVTAFELPGNAAVFLVQREGPHLPRWFLIRIVIFPKLSGPL
jgi:hypothetical protein